MYRNILEDGFSMFSSPTEYLLIYNYEKTSNIFIEMRKFSYLTSQIQFFNFTSFLLEILKNHSHSENFTSKFHNNKLNNK